MAGQSRRVEDTAVHHLSHGLCHGDSGGELYSPGHWRLLREAGSQSRSVNMLQCYILDILLELHYRGYKCGFGKVVSPQQLKKFI